MKGFYKGRAMPETFALGESGAGNKRVGMSFSIIAPGKDEDGHRVTWYGGFGDEVRKNKKTSTEMTFEALTNAGWSNFDLDKPAFNLVDVELVLDEEEVENETTGEVKIQTVVRWVNRSAGPAFKKTLEGPQRAKFAAEMKAKALLFAKQRGLSAGPNANGSAHPNAPGNGYGPPTGGDDDIPY